MNPALRKIAEEAALTWENSDYERDMKLEPIILRALHQAIRVVLEQEPSEEMCVSGITQMDYWNMHAPSIANRSTTAKVCYRAMTAQKLKELAE